MRKAVLLSALLVLAALVPAFAEKAYQKLSDPVFERPVTIITPPGGAPLADVARGLIRSTGYTPVLRDLPDRRVELNFKEIPFREAWQVLYRVYLKPEGLDYALLDGKVFLVAPQKIVWEAVGYSPAPKPKPAEKPAASPAPKEEPQTPEEPPKPTPYVRAVYPLHYASAEDAAKALAAQFPEGSFVAVGNKLVVRAPEPLVPEIERVLEALDEAPPTVTTERAALPLKYALPSAVAEMLKTLLPPPGEGPALRVYPDDQTHTLVLYGPSNLVAQAKELASTLDKPKVQYQVSVRIETADSTLLRNLGVDWQTLGGGLLGAVVNPADGLSLIFDSTKTLFPLNLQAAFNALERQGLAESIHKSNLIVDAGETAKVTSGFTFFLRTEKDGKIVKTPYDAGLVVQTTPVPTGDGSVELDLYIELSDILERNPVDGDIDKLSKRSTQTTLRVKPGSTVVLASVDKAKVEDTANKVPPLGDIPLLGYFFKSTSHTQENATLVITIQVEEVQNR